MICLLHIRLDMCVKILDLFVCSISCDDGNCPQWLMNFSEKPSTDETDFMQKLNNVKLQIHRVGRNVEMTLERANDQYISQHFPNIESNVNCWPKVYPMNCSNKDSKGSTDIHTVRQVFDSMFREKRIESFIISTYKWPKTFLEEVGLISDKFSDVFRNGEIDLMISIPRKCILLVEVKTASENVVKPEKHGYDHVFEKDIRFLLKMLEDVSNGCSIPVISVVAVPNTQRSTLTYCEHCPLHFVTKEDLMDTTQLSNWYEKLTTKFSKQMKESKFSVFIFKKLIGKLLGPCSLTQVQMVPHAITDTASEIGKLYYQLTPQQFDYHCRLDEKFVWIKGVPGSGKTMLGFSKAFKIISDSVQNTETHVLYIINGSSISKDQSYLMKAYKEKFKTGNKTCQVIISECHQIKTELSDSQIPKFIAELQTRHKNAILHVLIEECQVKLGDVDPNRFTESWKKLVKEDRLGNVWIIQNSFAAKGDSSHPLPKFNIVDLNTVLRMSEQTIKFLNTLLNTEYIPGHAITGSRPIIYRMRCICRGWNNEEYYCRTCYDMRLVWMLLTAITDLQADTSIPVDVCTRNVLITLLQKKQIAKVMKYCDPSLYHLSDEQIFTKVFQGTFDACSIHEFTGCERSNVFVEFNSILEDDFLALESLTRSVRQMILLDGGYCNETDKDMYYNKVTIIKENEDKDGGIVRWSILGTSVIEDAKNAFDLFLTENGNEDRKADVSTDIEIIMLCKRPRPISYHDYNVV